MGCLTSAGTAAPALGAPAVTPSSTARPASSWIASAASTNNKLEPETRGGRLSRVPDTMRTVPAVLLAGALSVGLVPSLRPAADAHTAAPVAWFPAGVTMLAALVV
ncbi:hypothetical protein AB0D04_41600 [Streptomyces sp. NPDC048483]|uniref:hypothetical protein n=1 Tax=Streptomyces sp. NPDC048483 TaxID=3154927 RepID=UPI003438E9F8